MSAASEAFQTQSLGVTSRKPLIVGGKPPKWKAVNCCQLLFGLGSPQPNCLLVCVLYDSFSYLSVFRNLIIIEWNFECVFVRVTHMVDKGQAHSNEIYTPFAQVANRGCKICFVKMLTVESRILGKPSRTWMCVMIEQTRQKSDGAWWTW